MAINNDMKKTFFSEKGLLSLEASISLTIFIFLMLFMYSFLVMFEVRNEIGHVLLTTADSLALDAYANEALDGKDSDDICRSIQGVLYEAFGSSDEKDGNFVEKTKWYNLSEREKKSNSPKVANEVRERFISYLSGGSEEEAEKILKTLNVVDGLDGLDFSESSVSGSDLKVVVKYKVDYEFKVFGFGTVELKQSCSSRLWK